jgi:hypothetical protein
VEDGISPIFGIGGQFQASPNFSIRVETEYIPNAGDGTNHPDGDDDNNTGEIDVLLATINLIWHPSAQRAENPFLRTGTQWSSATGFYVGGGVAGVSLSGGEERRDVGSGCNCSDWFNDNVSDFDIGGKVFAGWRAGKNLALEVGYHNFNDAQDDDVGQTNNNGDIVGPDIFDAQGVSFSLMAILPMTERTSAFLKLGGIFGWLQETDPAHDSDNLGQQFEEKGYSALIGTGLNFDITKNISVRGEVEWFPHFAEGNSGFSNDGDLDDQETGATADIDIITSSLNLIWWFDR